MCCNKACNKVMLKIITPNGEKFNINPKGQIIRLDMKFDPSDSWKFLGIEHVKRNQFIPFDKLTPENIETFKTWKNGNPQWTVRDLDHGTTRVWWNTKYHGIKRMYFEIVDNK